MKIQVELFSSAFCYRCKNAKKKIADLIVEMDNPQIEYHELDVIEHLDDAVTRGVFTTPSIIINGRLVFSSMPTLEELKTEILKCNSSSMTD